MQRDVPGIDHSFLAMDTEEGVEVVWNEVQFSERKSFKSQEVPFVFNVCFCCAYWCLNPVDAPPCQFSIILRPCNLGLLSILILINYLKA